MIFGDLDFRIGKRLHCAASVEPGGSDEACHPLSDDVLDKALSVEEPDRGFTRGETKELALSRGHEPRANPVRGSVMPAFIPVIESMKENLAAFVSP